MAEERLIAESVSREEFDLVCEMLDLLIGSPNGIAHLQSLLSWQGQATFEQWAKFRKGLWPAQTDRDTSLPANVHSQSEVAHNDGSADAR